MKKDLKKGLLALLCGFIALSAGGFAACDGSEPPPSDPGGGQEQPGSPVELSAPVIGLSEGRAIWAAVEGATSYKYVIDDGAEQSTTQLFVVLEKGQSVKVKAIAGDGYLDSGWSATVEYTVITLKRPTVTLTSNRATWTKDSRADGYAYRINGGDWKEATEDYVDLEDGQTIEVKAVGDGYEYGDSSISFAVTYEPIEITVVAGAGGTVSGSGKYESGSKVTITATPNAGYHFVKWSDNNTSATRQITATEDKTYTAIFAPDSCVVAVSCDAAQGGVSGNGTYEYGQTATIVATAKAGYHFVRWSDGDTNATRELVLTGNITLAAEFAINTYTVSVTASNGTVMGAGTYEHGTKITLTATPDEGYHFVKWSDNNTNATRQVTVTDNKDLTAIFAINTYQVTVSGENGTVTGGGTYNHGATVTLMAAPNTGYHFVKWSDGNTNATRQITATEDKTYTAEFAINTYTITATSTDESKGSVSGSGTYEYGDSVTLTATAATGYKFVQWSDGDTNATKQFTASSDVTLTAEFAIKTYTVTITKQVSGSDVADSDVSIGKVTGAGTYNYGTSGTLTAETKNNSYYFAGWYDKNGNLVAENASYDLTNVTEDKLLIAKWELNAVVLTLASDFDIAGTLSGDGTYALGTQTTLRATPGQNYTFLGWYDGSTLLSTSTNYNYTVNAAKTITAKWQDGWKSKEGYAYWTFDQLGNDVLPIIGFNTPNAPTADMGSAVVNAYGNIGSQINDNSYKLMAESGVNVACGWWNDYTNNALRDDVLQELDLADKYGIAYIVNDSRALKATSASDLNAYSEYMSKPAYAGTIIIDEPGAYDFADIKKATAAWAASSYSNTLSYVNMLPNYADPTWQLENIQGHDKPSGYDQEYAGKYSDYGTWIKLYLDSCKPQVFSYDYYPYMWDGSQRFGGNWVPGSGWYANLSTVRYYTAKAGVPFWVYGQAGTWQEGLTTDQQQQMAGNNTTDKLTYGEMALQYNSMLAYGAKGFGYYNYFTPINYTTKADVTACVDVYGNPTIYYEMVQKINKQALAAGKYLLRSAWKGVLTLGGNTISAIPTDDKPYANGAIVNYYGALATSNAVTGSGDAVVGCFEYRDIGWVYYVSSNNTSTGATVSLNLNGTYSNMTVVQNGAESTKSGNKVILSLGAGEGALVVVPKK